jgi:hypothetical protein
MVTTAIILSSLALLAALACLAAETKRSHEQKTALADFEERLSNLEKGVVPDFEKAKAAADAVNDFNTGISGILGFDPHEVLKKQRREGGEQL